jgi:hypothetical protein
VAGSLEDFTTSAWRVRNFAQLENVNLIKILILDFVK